MGRLLSSFPSQARRSLEGSIADYPLIGLEVEVRWSSFFPHVAAEFFKDGKSYYDLSEDDKRKLSAATSRSEAVLLPLLEAGLEAGLKRGRDRYWEHVLPPTTDMLLQLEIIGVLVEYGLIPKGRHPLHLTIGSVKATRDTYFALLALELLTCDEDRILAGFHAEEPALKPAGWSKKGRAGIFTKVNWDMSYDLEAVELRTPMLDTTEPWKTRLAIGLAYTVAKAVRDLQAGESNALTEDFCFFRDQASSVLTWLGLPDENWLKPHQRPEVWSQFAGQLHRIKDHLREELGQLVQYGEEACLPIR